MDNHILKWVTELHAISQNGMTYSKNEFDIERYHQVENIAKEMAAYFSDKDINIVENFFSLEKGYATPKLDVRAFILKEKKLLLVKERSDHLWTLPGGWVDVNESPSESVTREVLEETGFNIRITRLLALWDKLKHDHPPQWPHTYKIFFLGEIISGCEKANLEISEIDFFPIDELPNLSTHRVTRSQINRLHELSLNSGITVFD
ncbi:Mutator MutT protein [Legionella moravica]|uniref:Mutator MutT protein n=1 Tax=Legionella moravica TaxID=39962 RepID=A0A378JZC3_9GAMM|nr:NUDIX hydrolase N-terminal domain-containing protein [Legionella moravica]KTD34851.1 Mutator MutT protein [Legionella moravica]STX63904.1 Mutator MutT protein [Legionella moravica]